MPLKDEKPVLYVKQNEDEWIPIHDIEPTDIEAVVDSEDDFSAILENGISESFELSFDMPTITLRELIRQIIPNNWLKIHGYPMRRRFKR